MQQIQEKRRTSGRRQAAGGRRQRLSSLRPGFTLTELLIVIAIIAVLAGLIAAAAVNALRAAKRNRISLEIKNISASVEEFKNDYGAYPPNGMNTGPATTAPVTGSAAALVRSDFVRMFKKAFPRHQESNELIDALAGIKLSTTVVTSDPLKDGMTAAEALYFWLGGFSADELYPISGTGGPSFLVNTGEVIESRNIRYEFDVTRLGPRNDDGTFKGGTAPGDGRFVTYRSPVPTESPAIRQINFWRYTPPSSQQPLVYFDTSRYKPAQYDFWAGNPDGSSGLPTWIVAFKQLRSGAAAIDDNPRNIAYVEQGKFQILHAGLDDSWSQKDSADVDLFRQVSLAAKKKDNDVNGVLLFPQGPFLGEIADTLTNFTDGTIEDAAEE